MYKIKYIKHEIEQKQTPQFREEIKLQNNDIFNCIPLGRKKNEENQTQTWKDRIRSRIRKRDMADLDWMGLNFMKNISMG